MNIDNRTRAGDNERIFASIFASKIGGTSLLGKKRYRRDGIEISVDQTFVHEGVLYLIEVDSGNMAKLIVGQYILLNCLRDQDDPPGFFIAVHTYKKYNPQRTVSNLSVINRDVLGGNGIPFGVVHIDTLNNGDFTDANSLLNLLVRA